MDISQFKDEAEYVAQMKTGALLNPRIDSTFKALFTQQTEESKEALRSFLEAATERRIASVRLTASDTASRREANEFLRCKNSQVYIFSLRVCA